MQHCATRLRIVVHDKDKINVKEVENLDKVKGSFFNAGQYQIILGTGLVNRVYDEAMTQLNLAAESPVPEDTTSKPVYGNKFQRAIRMFSDVFVPILPVLVATGLFMGLRGLLTQEAVLGVFGMTPDDIPNQLLLFTQILTDTAFAFLPALVCWPTFKNFGGSPVVGIVLALFVLGPILHTVENVVLYAVEGLLTLPFGIGGLLYGGSGQLLGIFGSHHILNFLEISMLANDGWNYLNPIGTCGNVAQAGAVLAVAIKALSAKTKQVAYPSCLSALLGITEPAVFGVNLRFVKPFIMAMIGISASKTSAKPQSGCVMYKVCRSSFPQRTMNFSRSTAATPKKPTKAAPCCIRVYSASAAAMVPAVRVTNPFSPSCSPEQPSKPKKSTDFS